VPTNAESVVATSTVWIRRVTLVTPGGAVGGRDLQAIEVVDEPVGLEDDEDVARPPGIVAVEDGTGQGRIRDPSLHQGGAGDRETDSLELHHFFRHGFFHHRRVEPMAADLGAVQVDIGGEEGLDQLLADSEPSLETCDPCLLVPRIGIHVVGLESELPQLGRRFGTAVVGRENDQGVGQADLVIHECQQLGQGAVEPTDVVLGFEARGTEDVPDVIRRGETDGKEVGDRVGSYFLVLDQGFSEVESQLVPSGAERQIGREVLVVTRPVGMGEDTSEGPEGCFPGLVVLVAEQVGGRLMHQFPAGVGEALGRLFGVECRDPVGVGIEVEATGDEFARGFGKPEGLSGVTGE